LFDVKLSIQHTHAFAIIIHHSQTRITPTSQSTIFSAICARSHFQLLAVAAKKVRTRVHFLSSRAAKKKLKTPHQAPACYLVYGMGLAAVVLRQQMKQMCKRVHEGGGTQYRFSPSDSPGKRMCVSESTHARACRSACT
jgi:hypothetical protein